MPVRAAPDARRIILVRGLRGFADGLVSILLPGYLTALGFTPLQVGAIVTGTLLGSAALTVALGLGGHRLERRSVLLGASLLMLGTGVGFAGIARFWPLLVVAVLGTLNPSAGDVSVFLPTEQAALAQTASGHQRTRLFAWYNVTGNLSGALGSLAGGVPALAAQAYGVAPVAGDRAGFLLYALVGIAGLACYAGLGHSVEVHAVASAPLARSRPIVIRLAALFSLDSFGGGFAVQSLLVLWLYERFHVSVGAAGSIFFAAGLVPTAPAAIAFLLLRASLSQMDVPVRQAFVMAVVPPEERAAASSVTNVPRSLAAAVPPIFTGAMLGYSALGWPLVCGGLIKAAYDVLLLMQFRGVSPSHD